MAPVFTILYREALDRPCVRLNMYLVFCGMLLLFCSSQALCSAHICGPMFMTKCCHCSVIAILHFVALHLDISVLILVTVVMYLIVL